jgi:hypothetical protein
MTIMEATGNIPKLLFLPLPSDAVKNILDGYVVD